jgi:TolA-binding protein
MEEHDPLLTQAYRDAAHPAPGVALDARILAHARQAVQAAPPRPAGWRRWLLPASSMAVVVLASTLVLTMWRTAPEQFAPTPQTARAPTAESLAPPTAAPGEAASASEQRAATARSEPAGSARKPAERVEASPPRVAVLASDPVSDSVLSSAPVASLPPAAEAGDSRMPAPPMAGRDSENAEAPPRLAAPVPFAAAKSRATLRAGEIAGVHGTLESSVDSEVDSNPQQAIRRIRDLLRDGQLDAARRALQAFVQRYPEQHLPEDLRAFIAGK